MHYNGHLCVVCGEKRGERTGHITGLLRRFNKMVVHIIHDAGIELFTYVTSFCRIFFILTKVDVYKQRLT
jgi:hypothetical protein